jgi:Flp pilus assembly protein TadG
MNRQRLIGRRNKGSTAVECAWALIIFIMLVIGIVEFGRYFFIQHTLQYATREGMRLALVGRQLTDPSGKTLSREASIIQTIKNDVAPAIDPATVSVSIYKVDPSTFTDPTGWQGTQSAGSGGDYMRVRSQYTHTFISPLLGKFFTGSNTVIIQAEGTYRNELFD